MRESATPWFAENYLQLARDVHRGMYDKFWTGFLASPPRGGMAKITFEGHLSVPTGPGGLRATRIISCPGGAYDMSATHACWTPCSKRSVTHHMIFNHLGCRCAWRTQR